MGGLGPVILDISRTVSRIGAGGDSGVDRVERAYIDWAKGQSEAWFLTRVLAGMALLDAAGIERLLADAARPLPAPDIFGLIARRQNPARRRAETLVRRHALGWARMGRVPALLKARAPQRFAYINTGQLHLTDRALSAIRTGGARSIAVLIHDVIPIDHPEFSRPEATARFKTLLDAVQAHADLLIFNSADTGRRTARHMAPRGPVPASVIAHLGIAPLDPARRIARQSGARPGFVILGTIEPRKNHRLLLDIWQRFHDDGRDAPHLHIIGRRGWRNEAVFDILDRAPFMGKTVFEHGHLPDEAVAGHLAAARALLFPSFAEGFGFPLAEALQLGIPAVCSDLPVFREVAGDAATYLDPLDGPGWSDTIVSLAGMGAKTVTMAGELPTWDAHFAQVVEAMAKINPKTSTGA